MQIREIMTRDPVVRPPDTMLREAAQVMRDLALVYVGGKAMPRDVPTGMSWFRQAIASGDVASWRAIGYEPASPLRYRY